MAQPLKIDNRIAALKGIAQKAFDLSVKATQIGTELASGNVADKKRAKKVVGQANKFASQLSKASEVSF